MKERISTVFYMALMLALLAASLPMDIGIAQRNQLNCPPFTQLQNFDPGFVQSLPKDCLKKAKQPASPQLMTLNQITLLSGGGPDEFGYTFDDTVPFDWISAAFPFGFGGDDSSAGPSFIGGGLFTFPFYGTNYTTHYTSTNGLITFDQGSCCDWGGSNIPNAGNPNNFIAPFWDDLVVGAPYNSGGIYWDTGGTAPDRYYVVEWRDVTTYYDSTPFSFEVILYENGDILIQHQSLPASYYSTVGIEDASGYDGLQYHAGDSGLSVPKAIKFFYPTAPTPRLQVTPLTSGKFAKTVFDTYFPLTIKNNGSAGTDTYDLTAFSSWTAAFYQDGCVTPLSDTDVDAAIDTGPLPEGSSVTICVGFTPPAGTGIGDANSANILVASSLDHAKTKTAEMSMTVPTSFAQVFEDYVDAAMVFRTVTPASTLTNHVTDDFYYANGLATIGLPDGRYLYAWRKPDGNYPDSFSDIEFTFLSNDATASTPVVKLTGNVGTGQTYDYAPALAVSPNGTIGVAWYRWLVDNNTGLYNYNIYFATMSNTGTLLSGPVNVTNNNLWDDYNDLEVPHYSRPTIAGTDDNRFILSWHDYRTNGVDVYKTDIEYSIFESGGTSMFAPAILPSPGDSYDPILNPVNDGKAILTFIVSDGYYPLIPYLAVIASDGTLTEPAISLDPDGIYRAYTSPDAVALSNGNLALAWPTFSGIVLDILDPAYNVISGPIFADTPNVFVNQTMSVTRDSEDRVVISWSDSDSYPSTKLLYALADNTGTFITNPVPMLNSASGLITSENGQGNAPYPLAVQKQVLDDFNRADGLIGGNWSGNKARYRISDNQLLVKYNGSNTDIYWNEPFGADQEAFITFNKVNENATEQDLLLKAQSNHTWGDGVIEVLYDAQSHVVQVWTWEWPLGWVKYGNDIPATFVNGDTFRAIARANGTVEVYRNGVLLGTRDVSAWSHYADGGYIGLWFIDAKNTILDDFGGGDVP